MAVICCRVPGFLVALARRADPRLAEQPLTLVGADGLVCAASAEARACGVVPALSLRQALARCPDARLVPLDLPACESEHAAWLAVLARTGLPVEPDGWGAAYMDARGLCHDRPSAQRACADLGHALHAALGDPLAPALGWDTSKFTARAAAACASAGRMRLVSAADETRFLNPLPLRILPLPAPALQQLDWLGIRTLGQFARLPAGAIVERFGAAGRLAQRWAQGRDDRPVCPSLPELPAPATHTFDPPTGDSRMALEAIVRRLRPRLAELAERLMGCLRLRVELRFVDGSTRVIDCAFVEPLGDGDRLRATLSHQLTTLNWPAELSESIATIAAAGELRAQQLMLLPVEEDAPPLEALAGDLVRRHGAAFLRAELPDAGHPVPERRARFMPLASPP